MAISDPGRGLVRRLGVTAAALLAFAAASQQRAEALSLASPGTAPSAKFATDGLTTEVLFEIVAQLLLREVLLKRASGRQDAVSEERLIQFLETTSAGFGDAETPVLKLFDAN